MAEYEIVPGNSKYSVYRIDGDDRVLLEKCATKAEAEQTVRRLSARSKKAKPVRHKKEVREDELSAYLEEGWEPYHAEWWEEIQEYVYFLKKK